MEGTPKPVPPAGSLVAGAQIGAYRIEGELGRGGMGVVYKATHVALDKIVAIKVMGANADANAAAIDRLLAEGRTLAKLRHPNVVSVTDCGSYNGLPYIVLEYVEGGTVEDLLRRLGGRITYDKVAPLLEDLLSGLSAAHAAKIIHRDIKPSNLLIDHQGRVRISDFGLAQAFQGGADVTVVDRTMLASPPTVTQGVTGASPSTGAFGGTIQFMAPELHGQSLGDERSDIFAVGVMVYYLLTGVKPGGRFAPASKLVPGLSPRWDAFIDRCIAQRPEDRFASASEALTALKQLQVQKRRFPVVPLLWAAALAVIAIGGWQFFQDKPGGGPSSGESLTCTYRFVGFEFGDTIEWSTVPEKGGQLLPPLTIVAADQVAAKRPSRVRLSARRDGALLFPPREFDFSRRIPGSVDQQRFQFSSDGPSAVIDLRLLVEPRAPQPTAAAQAEPKPERAEPAATPVPAVAEVSASPQPSAAPTVAQARLSFKISFGSSPPDAALEARLDGALVRGPSLENGVSVAPGLHEFEVSSPRFKPYRESIRVAAGENRVLTVALIPRDYGVAVRGLPAAAVLEIDGVAQTLSGPDFSTRLTPGTHRLRLVDTLRESEQELVVSTEDLQLDAAQWLAGHWRKRIELPLTGASGLAAHLVSPGDYEVPATGAGLPARRVRIGEPFFIAEGEVTRGLFGALLDRASGVVRPSEPQSYVSARELLAPGGFLEKLNQRLAVQGFSASLPTEDEWDAAAVSPAGSSLQALSGGVGELTLLGRSSSPGGWIAVRGGHGAPGDAKRTLASRVVIPSDQRAPEWGFRLVLKPLAP